MHAAPRANKSVQNLPPWNSINRNSQPMVGLSNRVEPSQPQAIRDKTSDIGHPSHFENGRLVSRNLIAPTMDSDQDLDFQGVQFDPIFSLKR